MQTRTLRIILGVAGAALLGLGLLRTGAAILGSFHSSGSSTSAEAISLMIPVHWLAVAVVGGLLGLLAIFVGRRKV